MKKRHYLYCILFLGLFLGISNGNIALWKDGSAVPVQVFPYAAELLPKKDQQSLQDGIPIENTEQLTRLLEDFLS